MRLQDALFNWLQIRVVADARPDDGAAWETVRFFAEILQEDHGVSGLSYERNGAMYLLRYTVGGQAKVQMYDGEAVEQLLTAIETDGKDNG